MLVAGSGEVVTQGEPGLAGADDQSVDWCGHDDDRWGARHAPGARIAQVVVPT